MTGFGSSHSCLDSFVVTHFSQEDHIRTLAKRSPERSKIALGIGADFSLTDNTAVMSVQIFQRILKGNDMSFSGMIDSVNETCHGSGFAAACRAGYKNHALGKLSKTHNIFRNRKFSRVRQLEGDHPDNGCQRTSLFVSVDTKSGKSWNGEREIVISGRMEMINIPVGHLINTAKNLFGLIWHQPVSIRRKMSVDFDSQWTACNDKNVGCMFIGCFCKKFYGLFFVHNSYCPLCCIKIQTVIRTPGISDFCFPFQNIQKGILFRRRVQDLKFHRQFLSVRKFTGKLYGMFCCVYCNLGDFVGKPVNSSIISILSGGIFIIADKTILNLRNLIRSSLTGFVVLLRLFHGKSGRT